MNEQSHGFGPHNKPLAELTDSELWQEVRRRRQRRGVVVDSAEQPAPQKAGVSAELSRHLASLELKSNAELPQVEAAYARLQAKYRPFLNADSPERKQAAARLLDSLRQAYEAAKAQLSKSTSSLR